MFLKPLRIGKLQLKHNLVLAPLAGISDYPFRQLCREYGAELTFTEMVSVDGLIYQNEATRRLLKLHSRDHPIGFQFFGSDPEVFARILPEAESLGPDLIDLNFGCPVRKVIAKGAGAALLKDLDRLYRILETVRQHTTLPLSAKIRLGWDWENIVAEEVARAVESAGFDALTVHARTRSQGYSGKADWSFLARVKASVRLPVIGNGDVFDGPSAQRMFETTGVDGIMIARGALGRPWIFREILTYLQSGERLPEPTFRDRLVILKRHYRMEVEEFGEEVALSRMKKHFVWYTRGLPFTARLRDRIFRVNSYAEVIQLLEEYLQRSAARSVFSGGLNPRNEKKRESP